MQALRVANTSHASVFVRYVLYVHVSTASVLDPAWEPTIKGLGATHSCCECAWCLVFLLLVFYANIYSILVH